MEHDSNDNHEASLFKDLMRDVKPLKKIKTIEKIKIKPVAPKNNPPKNFLHEDVHDNLDKKLYSFEKKLNPYKPNIKKETIHIKINDHETITSESILSFGTERLSPLHQQQLSKGMITIQSKIDLHGMNRFEAQDRLNRFLDHARAHGLRHLLIIHGKGSKHGETPILKQHLFLWLQTYSHVLALQSAHAKHGGAGALYVLLKRHPIKHDK